MISAWPTASAASSRSWLAGAASIAVPAADSGARASALALGEALAMAIPILI